MVIAHGHSIRCFIGMSLLPEDTRHCLQHFRVVVKEKQRLYEERSVVVVLLPAFPVCLRTSPYTTLAPLHPLFEGKAIVELGVLQLLASR